MKINKLRVNPDNPQIYTDEAKKELAQSILEFPKMMRLRPIVYDDKPGKDGKHLILGGNKRYLALQYSGYEEIPDEWVRSAESLTEEEKQRFLVQDNIQVGNWDMQKLKKWGQEKLNNWGLKVNFEDLEKKLKEDEEPHNKLTDKFVVPPFSVLDSRQGYWKDRKQTWHDIIKDKGETRENKLSESKLMSQINQGVSILDPVLAELANRWFSPEDSNTFDPFAGDTVFGFVSSYLNRNFTGVELRQDQTDVNNQRVKDMSAVYYCDDGQNVDKYIEEKTQDLLFSCPPYFDLEKYSDLENDASNQEDYSDFLNLVDNVFTKSIKLLKDNRFAVIVVGDIRDKNGFYYGLVDDIKAIFKRNGMGIYNEIIMVEPIGTLPQRVGRYMQNRKVGKCHQYILVFYKGDPGKIKDEFPVLNQSIAGGEDETNKLFISYKWANKRIDCTYNGIVNGCQGVCCNHPNYYPAKSNGGTCYYLGDKGCILKNNERPIKCLLYPFTIKNDRLVLYGRALTHSCKKNYKPKDKTVPTIYENLKENLVALFGEEQYNMVYQDVIVEQKDSYFIKPDWFDKIWESEKKEEEQNIIPKKRNDGSKDLE